MKMVIALAIYDVTCTLGGAPLWIVALPFLDVMNPQDLELLLIREMPFWQTQRLQDCRLAGQLPQLVCA